MKPIIAQVVNANTQEAATFWDKINELINFFWVNVPVWGISAVIIFISFILAKVVSSRIKNKVIEKTGEEHPEVTILSGRFAYAITLTIGVTIGLKVSGIDLTTIIAAVSVGIGFALQDLITNFIAGIMILASKQFTVGDFIKVNDTLGVVKEIQSRATVLKAINGTRVIVPNSELFTNQVVSYTSNPVRRVDFLVGVQYSTNLQVAIDVASKVLEENKEVLDEPKPTVYLTEFSDSSINLSVRFWVESRAGWIRIRSIIIKEIKEAFDKAGITIPFPIRTLDVPKEEQERMNAMLQEKLMKELEDEKAKAKPRPQVFPEED